MKLNYTLFLLLFFSAFSIGFSQNILFNYGRSFSTLQETDKFDEPSKLNYKRINSPYYSLNYTQKIWKLINVEIGINYTEKGYRNPEIKTGNTTYLEKRIQLDYFSIPIMIKLYDRGRSGKFYPFASFGAYKSFLTGGDYEVEIYNTQIEDKYIKNDWGLLFEAGISYCNFEFNIGYNQGIKNIAKENFIEREAKTNTIYTSIGYNITLAKKEQ